jgi:hypothetical protein
MNGCIQKTEVLRNWSIHLNLRRHKLLELGALHVDVDAGRRSLDIDSSQRHFHTLELIEPFFDSGLVKKIFQVARHFNFVFGGEELQVIQSFSKAGPLLFDVIFYLCQQFSANRLAPLLN